MAHLRERDAIARAAREHGVDVDPNVLLAIVHTAFAPYDTMTAGERQFLIDSGVPADSFDPEQQAVARAKLVSRAIATDAKSAPLLSTAQVAELLGRAPSNVRRSAGTHDLYAVHRGTGRELGFPSWQFVNDLPLRGLREVLAALPDSMHPLSVEGFMTTPQEELEDRSPVEWLSTGGDVAIVVQLADSTARQ